MIYLMVVQSIVTIAAIVAIVKSVQSARDERRELEDRLLAVCHPLAQTQVSSERNYKPGGVKYVGEEATTYQLEKRNAASSPS